jgi:excisionase family DNA binding protein
MKRLLRVAEAAQELGVSRLRIRQMIAEGRVAALRDNEGHWRVRLLDTSGHEPDPYKQADPVDLLLDELLEAEWLARQREDENARLRALVERQQSVLQRSLDALDAEVARREEAAERADRAELQVGRATGLAERMLAQLEALVRGALRVRKQPPLQGKDVRLGQ